MFPADDTDIAVVPITTSQVEEIVALQVAHLEGSVITAMGPGFLDSFHRAALEQPATRGFVAVQADGRVVGFVLASTDVHAFDRHIKRRLLCWFVVALAPPARWPLIPAVVSGVFEGEPQPPIPAELLLLVVAPAVRRLGVGRRLVRTLGAAFAQDGISRYRVAVRSHLATARALYTADGFVPEQERLVLGRPMTYLTKRVTE